MEKPDSPAGTAPSQAPSAVDTDSALPAQTQAPEQAEALPARIEAQPDSAATAAPNTAPADEASVISSPASAATNWPQPAPFWTVDRVLDGLLILAIIAACALRVWDVFAHNPMDNIFSDTERHWTHAREPLVPAPMAMFDAPLYQIWLSVVQKWTLGLPELIALYAAGMSVLTPWLWYRFMREIFDSRRLARYGWLLFALLPSWINIFSYFMSETLLLPLMGAALWQTCRARRKKTLGAFAGMVLLWTLAAMTRGIAAPLAGIAGLWVWWVFPRKFSAVVVSAVIGGLLVGPIMWRNHQLIGVWAPFGNGYLNEIYAGSEHQNIRLHLEKDGAVWVYEFGSPSLYQDQLQPLYDWRSSRQGMAIANINLRNGDADWRAEVERNAARGLRALQLRAENLILVMLGESWPDNNAEYLTARGGLGTRWIWAPLTLLLIGVGIWRRRDIIAKPLVPALIITWFCFQAVSLISVNEGRYRKPLEGLLIVQALLMWQACQRRQPGPTVAPLDDGDGDKDDVPAATTLQADARATSEAQLESGAHA